jgi:CRP-like cAMP-binding protein
MSFLDRAPRSAEAVAATATELFSLSRVQFDELAERDEKLAAFVFEQLARGIAQRLRLTDSELRSLEER